MAAGTGRVRLRLQVFSSIAMLGGDNEKGVDENIYVESGWGQVRIAALV